MHSLIQSFSHYRKSGVFGLLVLMIIFCVSLSVLRCVVSGSWNYIFLNWNLFLAFLPVVFTSMMPAEPLKRYQWLIIPPVLGSWLLFFPNSPYILTDLFHLRHGASAPIWFDLVLILSYAWAGLSFGFLSLMRIEKFLEYYMRPLFSQTVITAMLFLSSFGVYLGRYLRWNSWDIFNNPMKLGSDIASRILHPSDHPHTWGMTILMGVMLTLMYQSIRLLARHRQQVLIC